MITPEVQELLAYADESHEAAKSLIQGRFIGFSAAQSYYTVLLGKNYADREDSV